MMVAIAFIEMAHFKVALYLIAFLNNSKNQMQVLLRSLIIQKITANCK